MVSGFSEKDHSTCRGQNIHKITNYSIKNRDCSPILTSLVQVHPRNIHTYLKQINLKFEENPCSSLRKEVEKVKKFTTMKTDTQ